MIFKDYLLKFVEHFAGHEIAITLIGGVSNGAFVIPEGESCIANLKSRCGITGNLWDYEGTVISNPTDNNDRISITIIPSKTEQRAAAIVEELMKDKDVLTVKGYWDMFFTGLPSERVFKANRLVAEYNNVKFYNGRITLPDVDKENVLDPVTSLTTNSAVRISKIDYIRTGISNNKSYLCTMEVGSRVFKGYIDNTPCKYGFLPGANAKEDLCRCLSAVWAYLLSGNSSSNAFTEFLANTRYEIIPYILGLDYFLLIKGEVEDYCVVFPKEEILEASKAVLTFLGIKRVVDLSYYKIVKTDDSSSKVIVDINTKTSAAAALMGNTATDDVSVIVRC